MKVVKLLWVCLWGCSFKNWFSSEGRGVFCLRVVVWLLALAFRLIVHRFSFMLGFWWEVLSWEAMCWALLLGLHI